MIRKLLMYFLGGMAPFMILAYFLTGQQNAQFLVTAFGLVSCLIAIGLYAYFIKQGKAQTGAYIAVIGLLFAIFVSIEMLPEFNYYRCDGVHCGSSAWRYCTWAAR